ncbi:tyrosine-type recombinase/integrase [Lysobacter niabensis]|uniref:tyrosine-type recombinase/integrase n=1 Tax=Agrilutibacter niabensis TaxID=380628 RepID=UPI00361B9C1C
MSTVRSREKLKPQREPHWHKLATGQFLGFRPSAIGKGGTWIARYYDPDTRRKPLKALGDFGHLPASDRFGAASADAREWFAHLSHGGSEKSVTVKEACETYAKVNPDAAKRFPRYVYNDPIARVKLQKLREHHVREWRARLESMPALVTRSKKGERVTRPRSPATVNRDMVAFRAALNAALRRGEVPTALAWQKALQPVEAKGRRNLYLDRDQRRALLKELPDDATAFCRGLCFLPLRPGALAALRAGDFDARRNELAIERDKAGGGRRLLVEGETAAMLREQVKSKLPSAPLFAQADGCAWTKDDWKKPIKAAVVAAGLPAEATAYTLRHSVITDLVQGGLDLLTVAQLSGTSVAMIEKHYGHLQRKRAAAALAGLAL